MQKIFCIGETNTGSDAVYNALQILNIKCLYANKKFNKAYLKERQNILEEFYSNYNVFLEGPFRKDYRNLHHINNAHSRFIFMDRDPIPWITDVINLRHAKSKPISKEDILKRLTDYVSFRKELLLYFKGNKYEYIFIQINVFDGDKSFLKWHKLLKIIKNYDYFDIYKTTFPKPKRMENPKFTTFEHIQEHFNISNNEFSAAVKGYQKEY